MNLYKFRPIIDSGTMIPGFKYLKDLRGWMDHNGLEYTFKKTVCETTFEPYLMLIIAEDKDATAFILKWSQFVDKFTK